MQVALHRDMVGSYECQAAGHRQAGHLKFFLVVENKGIQPVKFSVGVCHHGSCLETKQKKPWA